MLQRQPKSECSEKLIPHLPLSNWKLCLYRWSANETRDCLQRRHILSVDWWSGKQGDRWCCCWMSRLPTWLQHQRARWERWIAWMRKKNILYNQDIWKRCKWLVARTTDSIQRTWWACTDVHTYWDDIGRHSMQDMIGLSNSKVS